MINISRAQLWSALVVCFLGLILASPNLLSEKTAKALPSYVPSQQFNLGLDLQGGAYLLLEVDMKPVIDQQLRDVRGQVQRSLRSDRVRYEELRLIPKGVAFKVVDRATLDKATDIATRAARDASSGGSSLFAGRQSFYEVKAEGEAVTIRLTPAGEAQLYERVIDQSMATLHRRIDPEGTREVTIQRQGKQHIIVEVPGVSDTEEIKRRVGTTAKMTFHLPHPSIQPDANTIAPPGYKLLRGTRDEAGYYLVREDPELDGRHLVDAQQSFSDQTRQPIITFRFDTTGATIFCKITQENINKPFVIVLDNEVISAPTIRSAICGGSGIIEGGNFTVESATRLALLLRAGALPAPLKVVEERTVGATLGADSIEAGIWASIIGLSLVAFYMIASYGLFGVFAIVALFFNLVLLAATMSLLGATLTLPGIAGIVLSLGMAVDANVLIYERMREEIMAGRTSLSAIDAGFRRAFTAIADSNITTILAGVLLYLFGSGPVKGFGVTLAIGITASFFTAIMLTRIQVVYWWRWWRPKGLPIARSTLARAQA